MTDIYIEVEKVNNVDIVLTAVTGGTLPDGIVENTDVSYNDTVANGSTLVIPDINITKNDDTVVTSPAAIDLDLRVIDPVSNPATWDEHVAAYGRGYNYPLPTGQITSYRTGDCVDIESTIFAPFRVANSLKAQNSLVNFTTLGNTNSFGNTSRFTDSVGGSDYTGGTGGALVGYIIDNYTGLGWDLENQVASSWNSSIDDALASTKNGFSDWFLPCVEQSITVADLSLEQHGSYCWIEPFFTPWNVTSGGWSSTTYTLSPLNAWSIENRIGSKGALSKTNNRASVYCRKHF